MTNKYPITKKGFDNLQEELKKLKTVERADIATKIAEARAYGDLKENAEYHAARERQSFLEGRILELEGKVANAEVIDIKSIASDNVRFGATVTLLDDDEQEKKYQIVSEYESDIEKGLLSNASPLAKALIGKVVGDYIEVDTPNSNKGYEIIKIEYLD